MTLIVAGHDLREPLFYSGQDVSSDSGLESEGLYVAADSAITAPGPSSGGRKTLLGGFRKIYSVPVKLWRPYFVGELFQGYRHIYQETSCFLAFAGNTLTAQHVLNLVYSSLSSLKISCDYSSRGIYYKVLMPHERNPLTESPGTNLWEEDTFCLDDFRGILTSDVIFEVVFQSIKDALSSAKKYKLGPEDFGALKTEFAAGVYCPSSGIYRLFEFVMKPVTNTEGVYEIDVEWREVPSDEVLVLGMKKQFEVGAQFLMDYALSERVCVKSILFDYLDSAIEFDNKHGFGEIDRPAFFRDFVRGSMSKSF